MHRTVGELEETMSFREYEYWGGFQSLFDLPDAFSGTGTLGPIVAGALLGRGVSPRELVTYYDTPGAAEAEFEASLTGALAVAEVVQPGAKPCPNADATSPGQRFTS